MPRGSKHHDNELGLSRWKRKVFDKTEEATTAVVNAVRDTHLAELLVAVHALFSAELRIVCGAGCIGSVLL
ncbi:unnamed protein product [Sphagnum troendelagicum]